MNGHCNSPSGADSMKAPNNLMWPLYDQKLIAVKNQASMYFFSF